MCGICGVVGTPSHEVLDRMRDALRHRGPDESGTFVAARVGLAHRRLSIVDLSSGQQPLHSSDDSIVVVFNGEIYNHPMLRAALSQRGFSYRTNSDTESIANAYLAYGLECPKHLDGMFAFVLYDRRHNRVFGARDRFGKKPFFYSQPHVAGRRSFVFASEVRALLEHTDVRGEASIATRGVQQYLLHDYVPGAETLFANIRKLEAGHAFSIDLGAPEAEPEIWRYWNNPIGAAGEVAIHAEQAAGEVADLLQAAIERRLMADVPLGVFLSGGLDSSAITALLAKTVPAREIRTFSIGFCEPTFDESAYAAAVARQLGTQHATRVFSAADCLTELEHVSDHMDEPLADPSILPTSLLCRFARESVTVALGGDGGDELFAGYDPFLALRPARFYHAAVPSLVHKAIAKSAEALPVSAANMNFAFRVQRFLRGAKVPAAVRLPAWMSPFSPEQLARLMPDFPVIAAWQQETELYAAVRRGGGDEVRAALAYFQQFYLTDDILVKADRASMMHSLEVRAPFLDTALAEYVNRLPSDLKLRGRVRKYLLKYVLGRSHLLPPEILHRRKKGFGIPVAQWIRGELKDEFQVKLVHQWPESLGMISRSEIRRLLAAHVDGRENNYKELWALYVLGEWARRWAP